MLVLEEMLIEFQDLNYKKILILKIPSYIYELYMAKPRLEIFNYLT